MNKKIVLPFLLLATLTVAAQTKKPAAKAKATASPVVQPLKTFNDSLSYAFGISLGEFLRNQGLGKVNYALLNKAIEQTIKQGPTYLNAAQATAVISKLSEEKMQKSLAVEKEKG